MTETGNGSEWLGRSLVDEAESGVGTGPGVVTGIVTVDGTLTGDGTG